LARRIPLLCNIAHWWYPWDVYSVLIAYLVLRLIIFASFYCSFVHFSWSLSLVHIFSFSFSHLVILLAPYASPNHLSSSSYASFAISVLYIVIVLLMLDLAVLSCIYSLTSLLLYFLIISSTLRTSSLTHCYRSSAFFLLFYRTFPVVLSFLSWATDLAIRRAAHLYRSGSQSLA